MEPTIVSTVAVVISVATAVIGFINHKRIRSKCCGKEVVASVDIENTTPPRITPAPDTQPPVSVLSAEKPT